MIKRHIQGIPFKVLFLDDIFIGLDIGNRLPLIEILADNFPDYQIFMTTYDRPWFEYARTFLEQRYDWKTVEFYAQENNEGFEIPVIVDSADLIKKARRHLRQSDNKAAAVYTRSAFETTIRNYCEKRKKKVVFKSKLKDYNTQHFWNSMKKDVEGDLRAAIEQYRNLVLNPFSHYDTERHEIKPELEAAIEAVNNLRSHLRVS